MSIFVLIGILAVVLFGVFMVLGKGPLRSCILVMSNFVLGFGSLYLVNFCADITGFAIPVNIPTVISSGALGFAGTLLNGAVVALASV